MLVCSVGSHLRCLRTCYMAHFTEQPAVPVAWGFTQDADLAVKSSHFDSRSDLRTASPWNSTVNPKVLPHRQDQRVETFTLGFIHPALCSSPGPPCQTGFSCGDDFWFHNGLLPERGGERGQTYQLRDREAAAARQEGCKKGTEAASAGWVWKSWQEIPSRSPTWPTALAIDLFFFVFFVQAWLS